MVANTWAACNQASCDREADKNPAQSMDRPKVLGRSRAEATKAMPSSVTCIVFSVAFILLGRGGEIPSSFGSQAGLV